MRTRNRRIIYRERRRNRQADIERERVRVIERKRDIQTDTQREVRQGTYVKSTLYIYSQRSIVISA